MTEEEWKAAEHRMRILQACCGPESMLSDQERLELAAYRELKERREAEIDWQEKAVHPTKRAMMVADDMFEKDGATGTKTYVREYFLSALDAEGMRIVPAPHSAARGK